MPIADFSSAERRIVETTCNERWHRQGVQLHPADVELKLDPESDALTECPALFWQVDDCRFLIIKTRDSRYRGHFLYQRELEQYGTGVKEYDDLSECVMTLLQVQADHQSVRSGAYPRGRADT